MREVLATGTPEAVLFDVDGTLYRQAPVRRTMVARLVRHHAVRPATGYRVARILAAYRQAQEEMRAEHFTGDLAAEQLRLAAIRAGCEASVVGLHVERWMEVAPLDVIARHRRTDVIAFIDELADRGVALGVVSDYPATAKLAALGLGGRFAVVVSAQDDGVGVFKPDPRGLRVALERLGVAPERAWYVGDRLDVDQPAATAAGLSFADVGQGARSDHTRSMTPRRWRQAA